MNRWHVTAVDTVTWRQTIVGRYRTRTAADVHATLRDLPATVRRLFAATPARTHHVWRQP